MSVINTLWKSSLSDMYSYIRNHHLAGSFDKKLEVVELRGAGDESIKIETLRSSPEYHSISSGTYESFLIDYVKKIADGKNDLVIWDLGAHVGFISLILASHVKPSNGRIISFEPNINNVNNFRANLRHNHQLSNIVLEHSAVGNTVGELTFNVSRSKNNPTTMGGYLNTALPPLEQKLYKKMGFYATKVPCTTIDAYVKLHPEYKPHILKIDVEGAELQVLEGGANFLKERRPVLIIEVHHIVLLFKIIPFLKSIGYQLELLNEDSSSPSVCTIAAT